jgi:predicted transcriptional regulator
MMDRLEQEVDMLGRHLHVLEMVTEDEPVGIVKMSNETGYPHHKVRYSLRVLEEQDLIEPTGKGAVTTDRTSEFIDDIDTNLERVSDKLNRIAIDTPLETHQ